MIVPNYTIVNQQKQTVPKKVRERDTNKVFYSCNKNANTKQIKMISTTGELILKNSVIRAFKHD